MSKYSIAYLTSIKKVISPAIILEILLDFNAEKATFIRKNKLINKLDAECISKLASVLSNHKNICSIPKEWGMAFEEQYNEGKDGTLVRFYAFLISGSKLIHSSMDSYQLFGLSTCNKDRNLIKYPILNLIKLIAKDLNFTQSLVNRIQNSHCYDFVMACVLLLMNEYPNELNLMKKLLSDKKVYEPYNIKVLLERFDVSKICYYINRGVFQIEKISHNSENDDIYTTYISMPFMPFYDECNADNTLYILENVITPWKVVDMTTFISFCQFDMDEIIMKMVEIPRIREVFYNENNLYRLSYAYPKIYTIAKQSMRKYPHFLSRERRLYHPDVYILCK